MAASDAYGSMFHTLANRFKQHDSESNARASAQADMSRTSQTLSAINTARRPSYVFSETQAHHKCPNCRLLRRTSTVSSSSSSAQSPANHHMNDDCFGNFCPDISAPSRMDSHPRSRHHQRRPSLLADRDSGEESSASNTSSPAHVQSSRASVDPPDTGRLGKCQCGSIKPTQDVDQRYGREPLR